MLYFPVYKIFVGMNVASTIRFIAGQERPATLILTVISGLRITRACHVYNRDAETGN